MGHQSNNAMPGRAREEGGARLDECQETLATAVPSLRHESECQRWSVRLWEHQRCVECHAGKRQGYREPRGGCARPGGRALGAAESGCLDS